MTAKPEPKVVAATGSAAVAGAALWALGTYVFHGAVPDPVAVLVDVAVPGVFAFAGGWLAKHADRPPAGGSGPYTGK